MFRSVGFKIFFAFLFFTYIFQVWMYYSVEIKKFVWRKSEPDVNFYLSLGVFVLCFIFFTYNAFISFRSSLLIKLFFWIANRLGKIVDILWFKPRLFHIVLFLGASVLWYLNDMSRYRYDGVNVGSKFTLQLAIVVLWKAFFILDFWYHITLSKAQGKLVYPHRYLVNIGLLLSLTGTTSTMYWVIHTSFTFLPSLSLKILNLSISEMLLKRPLRVVFFGAFIALFAGILSYAYHLGENIKTGKEITYQERFSNDIKVEGIKSFFVQRFSTTLYAHTYLVSDLEFDYDEYLDHWSIPFDNLLYRGNIVAGNIYDIERPRYAQISQLNYQIMLIKGHDKTSGASPGLIPGFMYLFPPWLAIPFAAFILFLIIVPINNVVKRGTFIYASLTVLLLLDLFKATVDSFNPVSQNFLQLLLLIGMIGVLRRKVT